MRPIEKYADFRRESAPRGMRGSLIAETRLGRMVDFLTLSESEIGRVCPKNHGRIREVLSDETRRGDSNAWRGGTMQDLLDALEGRQDMAPFKSAQLEFMKSGLRRNLETILKPAQPKRARVFSEHDGEWSYDRRYEINPFQVTRKHQPLMRVLEMEAHFTCSSYVKAEEINRYGALVWGLVQLLETSGIQVGVTWVSGAQGWLDYGESERALYQGRVRLKKPGEYLAPNMLAGCFSSLFFRRLGFALEYITGEAFGFKVSSRLGSPHKSFEGGIHFEKGKLSIAPKAGRGYDRDIQHTIMKAIGHA